MDDNEHQRAGELGQTGNAPLSTADKGKGKAVDVHHDDPMDEDEDDEEESEESAHEEDPNGAEEPEDDDDMEEIDLNNIVQGGRRTRGKAIDFAKAAAENPEEEDEDEDDDEDFEDPDDAMNE